MSGTGEVVRWLKCLQHNHKYHNLDYQNTHKCPMGHEISALENRDWIEMARKPSHVDEFRG